MGIRGYPPAQPLQPRALLDRAASLGVSVVQIADNMPFHTLRPAELDDLERHAGALGLDIEVGCRGIVPEHLRTYLRLAVRFRSSILRVVIDTADHRPSVDEVAGILSGLARDFEIEGLTLAIENHDRLITAAFVSMLDRIGSKSVAVCLDTANSFGALEGPGVVVDTLAPRTANLHVDVPWLLSRLRTIGRDPNVILEQWTSPEATLDASIAKEAAWAAKRIAYLRQFVAA